jgi:hypothetical protein
VDLDAHAVAARRRQAEDALTFEQDREQMLVSELEDMAATAVGAQLDDEILLQMIPDDAELVRVALGQVVQEFEWRDETDELQEWDEDTAAAEPEAAADETAEEIERLQGEITASRTTQAALRRYLELLAEPRQTPPAST